MTLILTILLNLLGAYLLLNVLYLLVFSVAGHTRRPEATVLAAPRRLVLLLPAYHADAVALQTAPEALRHAYDGEFDVCVIADGLQPATVATLRQQGAQVVEVVFEKSTKGKALHAALEVLPPAAYDAAVILDVDNLMAPGFLAQVSGALNAGYRVVQGHRTAKNLDSPFAVLDACNEEINNHIFRQGHVALGLSSALIGSGMAFDYGYLRELLHDIGDTAGEDKELEFRILRGGHRIAYLPNALAYDEKIPNARVFTTQRTRWLAAQQEFLAKYLGEGLRALGRGNVDFFDKVLQMLLLPRVLLLGLLGALLVASVPLAHYWGVGPGPWFWGGLLLGTAAALLLALPGRYYTRQVGGAVLHLPVALAAMLRAMLQTRRAKGTFLHTPHAAPAAGSGHGAT